MSTQNASICANEQIKNVAVVMDKLPHYIRKIQDIKSAMNEISTSVEKMKKRAENLRVDAQSRTFALCISVLLWLVMRVSECVLAFSLCIGL